MKEENKTKAQLIEEFATLRRQVAELKETTKQQQVLSRVREEVWRMRNVKDIREVLVAIRKGLEVLGIPFQACDANIIDPSNLSSIHSHTMVAQEQWAESAEKGAQIVHHIWQEGEIAYRRDLAEEDIYQESSQLEKIFGYPVRSIIDIPFSHGTLAVNSTEANALSEEHIADLQALADVLSEGFQRLEDIQKLEQRNRELEEKEHLLTAFHQMGQVILSTLSQEQILDHLAEQIIKAGIFRSLMVALVHEDAQQVEVVRNYVCITDDKEIPGELIQVSDRVALVEEGRLVVTDRRITGTIYDLNEDNVTAEVARDGQMQVISDWSDKFDDKAGDPEDREGKVAYFIPVKQGERVLAILATGSQSEEKEEILHRIEVMQPLLDQFAIALEHARLYEDVQREITERKQAEEALRESELYYRQLFESNAFLILDFGHFRRFPYEGTIRSTRN